MDDNILYKISLNNFKLPISLDYDFEYHNELIKKLNKYIKEIREIEHFPNDIIKSTRENIKLITESLSYYYNANIEMAKKNIHQLLNKYKNNSFIISDIDSSYAFRGLASYDDLKDQGYEYDKMTIPELSFFKARIGNGKFFKRDMLHIPFDKREFVKTQRFSIPGVPCLYLGTTSYVCWLEMNKPQDNEFNVSSYKVPTGLKILNLVGDQMLINGQANICTKCEKDIKLRNLSLLRAMIEFFPLICATSYSVKNKNREFKSEYIVSQLVMQCLEELGVDGIAYISKKVSGNIIGYPQCVNLAIPIKSNGKLKMKSNVDKYGDLCRQILLTTPANFSEYQKISHSYVYSNETSYINCYFTDGFPSLIELSGRNIPYHECTFSKFDNYVYSLEHGLAEIFEN